MNEQKQQSFHREVLSTLSAIELDDKYIDVIEVGEPGSRYHKRLEYLSWAKCWQLLQDAYPMCGREYTMYSRRAADGFVQQSPVLYYPDGTGSVECTVWVENEKGERASATADLFVSDTKPNFAKSNPCAAKINKAKQRAFVKACAHLGLGMEIYSRLDRDESATKEDENSTAKGITIDYFMELVEASKMCTKLIQSFVDIERQEDSKPLSELAPGELATLLTYLLTNREQFIKQPLT